MFNQNRDLMGRFMNENELIEEWNEFVANLEKEKNAVQEQETESVDAREQAEDGKGLGEEDPKK